MKTVLAFGSCRRSSRFLVSLLLLAAACTRGPAAAPLTITLEQNSSGRAFLAAHGLSGAELRSLADARLDSAAWERIFPVTVQGNDVLPVAGRYVVTNAVVEFHPHVPFDRTARYIARFDPSQLRPPRRESTTSTIVAFDQHEQAPSTVVTHVYPSSDVWPANMLRFYIHFSAPMSRGHRTDFVHLVDEKGHEVPDAMLAAYADLWNSDMTRLTVFFDPGRVKRGVGPNVAMGRAIVEGRRYAITVDAAWPDATGRPLKSSFRREFRAGAPAYRALDVDDWRIQAPPAGSSTALLVTFPGPLDRALVERGVVLRTSGGSVVAGRATIEAAESGWSFVPDAPWQPAEYELTIIPELEDPAGNRPGRAFEVMDSDTNVAATSADLRRTFVIR